MLLLGIKEKPFYIQEILPFLLGAVSVAHLITRRLSQGDWAVDRPRAWWMTVMTSPTMAFGGGDGSHWEPSVQVYKSVLCREIPRFCLRTALSLWKALPSFLSSPRSGFWGGSACPQNPEVRIWHLTPFQDPLFPTGHEEEHENAEPTLASN